MVPDSRGSLQAGVIMMFVTGVDGCKGGWYVATLNVESRVVHCAICETFKDVIAFADDSRIIAVDIPIGLLSSAEKGGRDCDKIARKYLGPFRGRSVFSAPVRPSLKCKTYSAASKANAESATNGKGPRLSKQAYMIMPKICDVDWCLRQDGVLCETVREIHPELSFYEMNCESPVLEPKRTAAGFSVRAELLQHNGLGELVERATAKPSSRNYSRDDVLDAGAALWTAERIYHGKARRIPTPTRQDHQLDAEGICMEMWI